MWHILEKKRQNILSVAAFKTVFCLWIRECLNLGENKSISLFKDIDEQVKVPGSTCSLNNQLPLILSKLLMNKVDVAL